jgi:hypothetical protein
MGLDDLLGRFRAGSDSLTGILPLAFPTYDLQDYALTQLLFTDEDTKYLFIATTLHQLQ